MVPGGGVLRGDRRAQGLFRQRPQAGNFVAQGLVLQPELVLDVAHRASVTNAPRYTGSTKAFLGGFEKPVPVMVGTGGALFVGDWTTGTLYRIAA